MQIKIEYTDGRIESVRDVAAIYVGELLLADLSESCDDETEDDFEDGDREARERGYCDEPQGIAGFAKCAEDAISAREREFENMGKLEREIAIARIAAADAAAARRQQRQSRGYDYER